MLTPEREQQMDEILSHYPEGQSRSAVIPALWLWQEEHGWISEEGMKYVAQRINITPEQVREVATFYSMFSTKPIGRYNFQVCCTTPCMINGSDDLISHLERRLGVRRGHTTEDGLFTVSQVECLGSCDTAPMLQLNRQRFHENLTPDLVDGLIERCRTHAAAGGVGEVE
jgi:NADH-quinone oxidoreductase subunit E